MKIDRKTSDPFASLISCGGKIVTGEKKFKKSQHEDFSELFEEIIRKIEGIQRLNKTRRYLVRKFKNAGQDTFLTQDEVVFKLVALALTDTRAGKVNWLAELYNLGVVFQFDKRSMRALLKDAGSVKEAVKTLRRRTQNDKRAS